MGITSGSFPKLADSPAPRTRREKAAGSMKSAFGSSGDQPEQSTGHTQVDDGHEPAPEKSLGERIAEGLRKRKENR